MRRAFQVNRILAAHCLRHLLQQGSGVGLKNFDQIEEKLLIAFESSHKLPGRRVWRQPEDRSLLEEAPAPQEPGIPPRVDGPLRRARLRQAVDPVAEPSAAQAGRAQLYVAPSPGDSVAGVTLNVRQTIGLCRLSSRRGLAIEDRPRKAMVCPTRI